MLVHALSFFGALPINVTSLPHPSDNGNNILPTILRIVFAMAASITVLMVVIGGFRYIVANGDPGATTSAKNSIIYALVGLLVVMVAYSIVALVVKGVAP
jgi:hypothetical protein